MRPNRFSWLSLYKWVQNIIFLSCEKAPPSEQDGVKQMENSARTEESAAEILVQFTHPHTLCQLLRTICNSLHLIVHKHKKLSQQSTCLLFEKEPELNQTSSKSRPSSSTSQGKNREEKASSPTSHSETCVTTTRPNEKCVLILLHRFNHLF